MKPMRKSHANTANSLYLRYAILGGEIVTARGKVHVVEGDWQPKAITILKFENKQALMNWYQSSEYAPLKQMRLESNVGDFVVVDES